MGSVDTRPVVLTTDFKPRIGGVSEYLHALWHHVGRLRPVTVKTTVAANGCEWPHAYQLENLPPVPLRRLGERLGDRVTLLRKLQTARYFMELRHYAAETITPIQETSGPGVHAYVGIWDTISHFWCRELRRARLPYTLHVHGLEVVHPYYGRLPRWRFEDFVYAQELLANSRATADLIRSRVSRQCRVRVVNPGVSPPPDPPRTAERARQLRDELGLSRGTVLLTVGRLVRRKGVDQVLRSVARLAGEIPDILYVVAGEGPERDVLTGLALDLGIADRVRFLGAVDDATKWALYDICDVFVLPNRLLNGTDWEGFGIVFLEAAQAGKPAIGGRTGGVGDAVQDEETGLLVNPEDLDALTAAIERLALDADLRVKMGHLAAERARSQFDWKEIARSFARDCGWVRRECEESARGQAPPVESA